MNGIPYPSGNNIYETRACCLPMTAVHSIQYRATFAMLPGWGPPSTSDASPSHGIIVSCITYLHTAGTSPKAHSEHVTTASELHTHIDTYIYISSPLPLYTAFITRPPQCTHLHSRQPRSPRQTSPSRQFSTVATPPFVSTAPR